ncbi:MAG: hypothetical protein KIT84_13915 [Labilithrix sp.]|nr:hypothetical protein [Labilithrix sp.]MCW5812116.1 hypothetical protein [Labilithrix sp.]
MAAQKFSISFDGALASAVRRAAAEEGVSLSTWLADAAEAKARQRHLREALDEFAREHGALGEQEIEELVRRARRTARVSQPRAKRTSKKRPSRKVA